MALHIGRAIGRGSHRALNATGLLLAALTLGYVLAFTAAVNTLVTAALPPSVREQARIGLVLPASPQVAGIVMVVSMLFGMVIYVAATRAFTRDPAERGRLSSDIFTRRIGRALLSAVGANIVVSLAVTVGMVLLFVPGLFLSVSFVFVFFAIGVEDARAVDALRRSWELASGNRWRLLALVLIIGIGLGLLASVGSLVSVADPSLGQAVSLVITAPLAVISYGIVADAYDQLRSSSAD